MQGFYLVSTFGVWILAWRWGAAPEKRGVLLLVANYVAAGVFAALDLDVLLIANDALLLAGLLWLSALHRRWWILLASAMQMLILVAHYSFQADAGLASRTDVLYRYIPGVIGLYALGLGVVERWLAMEPVGGWRWRKAD